MATAFAFAFGVIDANAARTLLTDLMARPSAGPDEPAMSALALEACMRRAQELDRTGIAIDYEIAAIDREAAEALFLQKYLSAELPKNWPRNSRLNFHSTRTKRRPTTPRSTNSSTSVRAAFAAAISKQSGPGST
jgi:hypothetical protein